MFLALLQNYFLLEYWNEMYGSTYEMNVVEGWIADNILSFIFINRGIVLTKTQKKWEMFSVQNKIEQYRNNLSYVTKTVT